MTPDKTLQVREEEAEVVQRIFQFSVEENLGTRAIAARLNQEGCATRGGGKYTSSYITKILTNPVYCGELVYGRQKNVYRDGKRKVLYNRDFETFPGTHSSLVSRELFLKSGENMQQRKENRGNSGAVDNPWGGLLFCGECKAPMVRNARRTGEGFFMCGTYQHTGECSHHYLSEGRMRKETEQVLGLLAEQPALPGLLQQAILVERENADELLAARIRNLERQASACRDREGRLVELLERQVISEEDFRKRKEKSGERYEKLTLCVQKAKDRLQALQGEKMQKLPLLQLTGISEVFVRSTPEVQKKVLRLLLERIEVLKGSGPYQKKEVRFYFKI